MDYEEYWTLTELKAALLIEKAEVELAIFKWAGDFLLT